MNTPTLVLMLALATGCAPVTPRYDARFGDAVREARSKMTINPDAGKTQDPVNGMDGKAARDAITLYQGTFKAPPPVVNVINIGGALSGR